MFKQNVTSFILLLLGLSSPIYSQAHVSVPIGDPIYEFLEIAQIRGLMEPLPAARPYAESLIVKSLDEIAERRSQLSPKEQVILDDFLSRFDSRKNKSFWESGKIRFEDNVFPGELGMPLSFELGQDVTDKDATGLQFEIQPYLKGDLGRYLSYSTQLRAGAYLLEGSTHTINTLNMEPYKFSKRWDNALHPIKDGVGGYSAWTDKPSFGLQVNAEISASFWQNRLDIRFGRIRHEWGYGEGSLYLDALARPFMALEVTARPWKWLDVSSIYGMLEYHVYPGEAQGEEWSQTTAEDQQTNYSLFQIEMRPASWLTISFWDAAIFAKRLDLAYAHPLFSQTLSQHYTGDFDNLMLGGTLVLNWPRRFRFYMGFFIDEWNLHDKNFFNRDRNMYALQTGIKVPIDVLPWSRLVFQYTKIEPYTYTHPPTKTPWYSNKFGDIRNPGVHSEKYKEAAKGKDWGGFNTETSYMNNGEPMGYHLEPNSDEFLLIWTARPWRNISTMFKYRLIRHGVAGQVDGSSYLDYIPYYTYKEGENTWRNDELYHKDFLKDGLYEWFHVWALATDFNMSLPGKVPFILNLKYSLVYQYQTNYKENGNYGLIDNQFNKFRHIFSLAFQIFP